MKLGTKHPTLYELNTRICITELGRQLGRSATLADMPDAELDRLAALGFDWIWLLGVWQTGETGVRISRTLPELRQSYQQMLPDVREEDIVGSPFAIASYTVSQDYGGDASLAQLRRRLRDRGMRLMLDLVPNHTAIDHPWVRQNPGFYVRGSSANLEQEPWNYVYIRDVGVVAHGRDPYFPGWSDTLQLNYSNDLLQEAMRGELLRIADMCDGLRCDMAMLLMADIFQRTWGIRMNPFWPETIRHVRDAYPEFVFMAEVYWDMEWNLQQQGFDYTYDKRLYDRLRSRDIGGVRAHLSASIEFQQKSVRFLENHDEPRAAASFPSEMERAAAVITYFVPGLAFFHDGQLDGRQARASVHLRRRAEESLNRELQEFYSSLLRCLSMPVLRNGDWQKLESTPQSCFAFSWSDAETWILVVVNFSDVSSTCYINLPFAGGTRLRDLMSGTVHALDRSPFDLPAWGYSIFQVLEATAV